MPLSPRIIGKLDSCHLCLDKFNISRAHCEILAASGGYIVRDLGSRNGTYIDGKRISGEAPLREGTRIDLGSFQMTFHASEPAGKPAGPKADPKTQGAKGTQPAAAAKPPL